MGRPKTGPGDAKVLASPFLSGSILVYKDGKASHEALLIIQHAESSFRYHQEEYSQVSTHVRLIGELAYKRNSSYFSRSHQ